MYNTRQLLRCSVLCLWVFPGLLPGAAGTHFRIDYDILDSGGGSVNSTNYKLRASSLHPLALGGASSVDYSVYGGLVSFTLPESSSFPWEIFMPAILHGGKNKSSVR